MFLAALWYSGASLKVKLLVWFVFGARIERTSCNGHTKVRNYTEIGREFDASLR